MAVKVEQGFVILEGAVASVEEWREALHVDHPTIAVLLTQGVFQRSRAADGQARLRLNMVGLLATSNKAFFCLPKICADGDIDMLASTRHALAAVQTYHKHVQRGPEASRSGEADIFLGGGALLDHFLRLWEWTRDFGLHHDEEPVREDGYRSINWRATIGNSLPVHRSSSVMYPEAIGQKFVKSLSHLGMLQAFYLESLQVFLGDLADIWSDKYDSIWDFCREAISDSDLYFDDAFIRSVLDKYEGLCTRDNDRELLELLKGCLEGSYSRSAAPILYGVSSFHVVWEHMCSSLLREIGSSQSHPAIASQPSYDLKGRIAELEPQRPDILRSIGEGVIIGDAKWYKIDAEELPGTPDAIKQFSYQSSIIEGKVVVGNFLFLPTLSDIPWEHLGSLVMKNKRGSDDRFPSVQLIGLAWENMVSLYAKGGHFKPDFSNWLAEVGSRTS